MVFRLPARYLDPVTHLPYCNIPTFRILREAYYKQLEARGDRGSAEVAEWLEYRKTLKDKCLSKEVTVDPSVLQITKVGTFGNKNLKYSRTPHI